MRTIFGSFADVFGTQWLQKETSMTTRQDPTLARYLNGDYAQKNPDWDSADAGWKAKKIAQLLADHECRPSSIVEIGCGSGAVLVAMREYFSQATFAGFDIAPGATGFWTEADKSGIRFELADYLALEEPIPDLILVLDVLEHLGNPWEFLANLRDRAKLVAIHFPLDLSAISVLRERPLLQVRDKVGHLHYFTRGLALSLLHESGFEIIEARYTGAGMNAPKRSFKTKAAGLVRRLAYAIERDFGARLLGGETLMVLARPRGSD
jgi:SAM-dependent methyltransferase